MYYLDAVNYQLANDYKPRHWISFSSGVPSAVMTYLVLQEHPEAIVVFADTKIEDDDNYRFLLEMETLLGRRIQRICVGEDPYEVAENEGFAFIPNQLSATCTRELKIEPIMRLCREGDTMYLGYTHEDKAKNRDLNAPIDNYAKIGVRVIYPLIEQNIFTPEDFIKQHGVDIPRMYRMGYKHGNCGGTCVKQGQGDWVRTLIHFPERYADREAWEHRQRTKQAVRMVMIWKILSLMPSLIGAKTLTTGRLYFDLHRYRLYTLVRRQVDGVQVGISLRELREKHEAENYQPNFFDLIDELNGGGCTVECGVGSGDELSQAVRHVLDDNEDLEVA